ncbi:beta-Ala-His dipeptidase, partial [Candidatus Marithioploca araucensis]|nr:beta-Ala-His dipeptidase [Candidatus Marithioploca araucensis]
ALFESMPHDDLIIPQHNKFDNDIEELLQIIFYIIANEQSKLNVIEQFEMSITKSILLGLVIIPLLILPLLFIFGIAQMKRQTRPILHLTEIAKQIQDGKSDIQATVTTKDEIGKFTNTFNLMLTKMYSAHVKLESQVQERTEDLHDIQIQLYEAIESMNDGFALYDADDRLILCNNKFREFYSLNTDAIVYGTQFKDIIRSGAERRQYAKAVGKVDEWVAERLQQHQQIENISEQQLTNGCWLQIKEHQIKGRGIVGIHIDITERKQIEEELVKERHSLEQKVIERTQELQKSLKKLEDTNLSLEQSNRAKAHFLSSMSHELRTPLNGILGMSDMLHEQFFGPLNEKQLSYVVQITKSGKHLLSLISDLLDTAKIDAGTMELALEKTAIEEIIGTSVSMMKSQFKAKNLQIKMVIDPTLPLMLVDIRKCKQIMLNLLSNAIKYTASNGWIKVHVFQDSSMLKVIVSDNGMGIERKELDKIFSEFHQADRVRDQELGGTGIGLALTRRLVELHGADNGIAIAMAMTLALEKGVLHPPLELLFTVDEERGLVGASMLTPDFFEGRILVNIDSEEDEYFMVGCAGGSDTHLSLPIEWTNIPAAYQLVKINAGGMKGGHSGLDINAERANAIKILARTLYFITQQVDIMLADINSGTASNVIPRHSEAFVFVSESDIEQVKTIVLKAEKILKAEYKNTEPDLFINVDASDKTYSKVVMSDSTNEVIDFLMVLPHGVDAMSTDIAGLVETSNNLAQINVEDKQLKVLTSQRSAVKSRIEALTHRIEAVARLIGGETYSDNHYPGWQPNLESPLLAKSIEVYKKLFNKAPVVEAIHAGLETGIISEKVPSMDMIAIGPTIKNPHSPDEKMLVSSIGKIWDFLLALLKELK